MDAFSLVIPWRTDDGPRQRIFEWVLERWKILYGADIQLCVANSDPDLPFNRSQARNIGASRAWEHNIVIADADTVIMPGSIEQAFEWIDKRGGYAHPFNWYHSLKQGPSESILDLDPGSDLTKPAPGMCDFVMQSWAGAICMKLRDFYHVGGYDESFEGWGYEDTAFRYACETLLGMPFRAKSFVMHLWHSEPKRPGVTPGVDGNKERMELYEACRGNKEAMQTLIKNR